MPVLPSIAWSNREGDVSATAAAAGLYAGEGSPQNVVEAPPSSFYVDLNAIALYLKAAGTGATGWSLQAGGGGAVDSVNGQTGVVTLDASDIGLGNVDNTSDAAKNIAVATLTNKTISGTGNVISVNTTTYAGLPAAAGAARVPCYVTDVGLMVSDGTNWIQLSAISTTFASRGTPLFVGQLKRFTDVGYQGATLRAVGTSSAADWKVQTATMLYSSTANVALSVSASQQVAMQSGALPAAILQAGGFIEVQVTMTKTGTTDTSTPRIKLGTTGTTTDATIFTATPMSVVQISYGVSPRFKFNSATAITTIGRPDGAWLSLATTVAQQTATVPDISSSALIFTLTSQTSGANDTMTATNFNVILHPA